MSNKKTISIWWFVAEVYALIALVMMASLQAIADANYDSTKILSVTSISALVLIVGIAARHTT